MDIKVFELPPIGTNACLIIDRSRAECVCVDAPLNAFATVEKVLVETGCTLKALLLTHGHWDHTLDAHAFNDFGTPVYAHRGDKMLFEEPAKMGAFAMPGINMKPVQVDQWVEDGEVLDLIGTAVEVRHVPGHSEGSVLFWFKDHQFAISGDAVFKGSVGRTDLPGGSFDKLEAAIQQRIYTLPGETKLYPGHGPATTVAREMQSNPFVRSVER